MTNLGRVAVPTAVLAAALALAGCGGSDDPDPVPTVAAVVPGASPSASPRPTAPAQVDENDAAPEVESSSAAAADNDFPDGFPADEIPIVDGTVESGSRGKAGGPYAYSVIVRVAGTSAATVMAGITAQLTGAGFAAEPGPVTGAISASTFRNARYDVSVNVIRAQGRTTVTYVVVKNG